MNEFIVFSSENDCHEVVLMTTIEDLYFSIDKIYENLTASHGKAFKVIIDLMLRNGFSFNRFVELNFLDKNNYSTGIFNPRSVSEEIKEKITEYLKANTELLQNSALSTNTINFICSNN